MNKEQQLDFFSKTSSQQIIHGDCLKEMRKIESESIDCIVTDPPYGLTFMGKKWDKEVPGEEYWKEALRVSKPGAFLLAAGAPRSHHHLATSIENAGWEITDCIMHVFGSGFPKGKSQLKPAYEPWILARKKGDKCQALNIDKCRIDTNGEIPKGSGNSSGLVNFHQGSKGNGGNTTTNGRWPANIIFDEEAGEILDEQSGQSINTISVNTPKTSQREDAFLPTKKYRAGDKHGDSGGASRFFYCAKASSSERNAGLDGMEEREAGIKNASGRGFSERDPYGKIMRKNHHPTVKPLKLMEYLIKLVTPMENPILLDPFLGSGTTLLAAKNLGINAIGIEQNPEYVEISRKRIENK